MCYSARKVTEVTVFHFCVQAMARVASFLDPQNKEGISAVLCSAGVMTRGQAKLRPQQELRGSLQSTEEFEEIPDRQKANSTYRFGHG